jgi:hypothetical protein
MNPTPETARAPDARWGWAWVALCLALASHVTDEALTDFLSVYNPEVLALRARFEWFPMPTFTFIEWLTGLIIAVIALSALSLFAFRGQTWMVPVSYLFGGLMLMNGAGHLTISLYQRRLMPGALSSPALVAAAAFLLVAVRRRACQRKEQFLGSSPER